MRRRFTSNRKTTSVGYCAITATQDNTNISCTPFEYIYYAINDISNWSRGSTYVIATLNAGDTVYLKSSGYVGFGISCDKAVELSGSILSLVYGDNHSNETSLSHIKLYIAHFSNVVRVSSDFLPSKDLGKGCYQNMFLGCTGLIKAPKLPATTLADYCYNRMFDGCTNLNYIKMLATDISAYGCLNSWVQGVSPTGTFVKSKDATWDVVGDSGVPTGWKVITDDQSVEFGEVTTFYDADMGESFNFVFGMTWREFIDSEYNTGEYSIEQVGTINPVFYVVNGYGSRVGHYQGSLYINAYADDIIVPNINYFE